MLEAAAEDAEEDSNTGLRACPISSRGRKPWRTLPCPQGPGGQGEEGEEEEDPLSPAHSSP